MAHPCQLLGCGQTRGASSNHGHRFTGLDLGGTRCDPTFGPCAVNDRVFNRFDTHRIVIHVDYACSFARCGADTAGEFREIIGTVQDFDCILPIISENQLIEIRNDVVDWATTVAKRRAAVHATGRLCFGLLRGQSDHKFSVMLQAIRNRFVSLFDTLKLHEAGNFSHGNFPSILTFDSGGDKLFSFGRFAGIDLAQGALVLVRKNFHKLGTGRYPVVQQLAGALAAGPLIVVFE